MPALTRFVSRYPDVQIDLKLRDHPSDFVSEGIDVAVRLGPLADSALIARHLGRTRMRICGAPGYLRRKGRPRTVRDLARHELLGFSMKGRVVPWRVRDGTEVRELSPGRRIVVESGDALVDLAVNDTGLAWLCDFMMAGPARAGQLVEILAGSACEERPIHVLSAPGRHVLPKVRAFVDLIATELAENGVSR